jgi:hypothetical protein
MPPYGQAPPTLLQPGQNGYFFGSYNANKPNPRFAVTSTAGDGATATIIVALREGFAPAVGDLVTVSGTTRAAGAFNVTNVALSAVSLDPVTGVGTLQYASTGNVGAGADAGQAIILNGEVPELLPVNGASQALAIQTAAGQNDNGKNIAWATRFTVAPLAVTLHLQGALLDIDADYVDIGTTTSLTGDNLVVSNVTQRFYRILVTDYSGSTAKIISKMTI